MRVPILHYDLREIVTCPICKKKEYWGKMGYVNGIARCRECYSKSKNLNLYQYTLDEKSDLVRS